MMETVYFGTYTKKTSRGIYAADLDTATGTLDNLRLFAEVDNPTYLSWSEDILYSVAKQGDKGGAASFDKHGQLISTALEEGAPLCYLANDKKRHLLYGANYHKGEVLVYKTKDSRLSLKTKLVRHGSGPHPNQASSHVHFADLTPDHFLVTCDLGTDSVTTYEVLENGALTAIGNYHSQPGAGSRHIVFHPYLKMAYLICELNSTIETLFYDGYGQFERYQIISTLPDDYTDFNACAAIRLSSDGKFLYASNRGHDSIAIFQIIGDGELKRLQILPTGGKNPRDFNITPDGHFLIVGHQDTDLVTVFKRDKETGLLNLASQLAVPEVVCVAFKH